MHHATMDKKLGIIFEKLGFMETHFIDIREELTKKFEGKINSINEVMNITKIDMTNYIDKRIENLDFGPEKQAVVNKLVEDWDQHIDKFD